MRGSPGELPVLDFLGARPLRLPLALAIGINERVGQDAEQPGFQVRAVLVLMERTVRLGEGLLHQVLGISWIAGHPHRRRVQLIQVRQDITLEAFTTPLLCLRYRTHPLRLAQPDLAELSATSGGGYRAYRMRHARAYPNVSRRATRHVRRCALA